MRPDETVPADTTPEIDSLYWSLLMRRSGAERLYMGAAMFDAARVLMTSRVRAEQRGLSELQVRLAVFMRIYSPDLDENTLGQVVERLHQSTSVSSSAVERQRPH